MTNLDSIFKSNFVNKGLSSQGYGFSSGHVWMWELDYKESWAPKNWCFWTVVLEKTLESPLNCKDIQPVHPKGDQSWVFIGRTDVEAEAPILWPPDVKNWLIGKDPDAGKDSGQEEKGTTEDEMVGWHHRLDGHGFRWPGVLRFMGSQRVGYKWATELNWTELKIQLTLKIRKVLQSTKMRLEPFPRISPDPAHSHQTGPTLSRTSCLWLPSPSSFLLKQALSASSLFRRWFQERQGGTELGRWRQLPKGALMRRRRLAWLFSNPFPLPQALNPLPIPLEGLKPSGWEAGSLKEEAKGLCWSSECSRIGCGLDTDCSRACRGSLKGLSHQQERK